MLLAVREIILWFLVYEFIKYGMMIIRVFMVSMPQIPQAEASLSVDSAVPIWSQIKEKISVVGIMGSIVAFYGVIVALMCSRAVTLGGIAITALSGRATGIMSTVTAMGTPIQQIFFDMFPFSAFWALLIGHITLELAIWPLALVAQGVVKAIKG
jgi:hypothetical protein